MQYLSELEQLLLTAKHPRIRLLLQKALNDASIAQHSEVVAVDGNKSSAEEKEMVVPPLQGPVKATVAGMSKITNYGESTQKYLWSTETDPSLLRLTISTMLGHTSMQLTAIVIRSNQI